MGYGQIDWPPPTSLRVRDRLSFRCHRQLRREFGSWPVEEKPAAPAVICRFCQRDVVSVGHAAGGPPAESPRGGAKVSVPRVIAKTIHWLVAAWTVFCIVGALTGLAAVASRGSSTAASVGAALGMGLWAALWFVPVVAGELVAVGLTVSARKSNPDAATNRREWMIGFGIAALPNAFLALAVLSVLSSTGHPTDSQPQAGETVPSADHQTVQLPAPHFVRYAEDGMDRCILLSNWDRLDDSLFWRVAREIQAREVERIKTSDVKLRISFWTDLKFVPTTWPPSNEELKHRVAVVTIDVPNHVDQLSRLDQKRRQPKALP